MAGAGLSYSLENIKIYDVPFDITFNQPHGLVGKWMNKRGRVSLAYAKAHAGSRTGHLKASIRLAHDRKAPGRGQQVRIGVPGTGRGYALLHHEGSAPHVITGKRGRMLSFNVRGRRVITKSVRHPGTRANHYLTGSFKVFMGR